MAEVEKALSDYLDDMALKILMIEPGDLSVVGELLEFSEQLLSSPEIGSMPVLQEMAKAFKSVLEKIIMAELPDSAENYDRLGQCISQMQEAVRQGSEVGEAVARQFCDNLKAVGFEIDPASLAAGAAEPAAPAAAAAPAATDSGAEAEASPPAAEQPAEAPAAAAGGGPAMPDFLQDKDLLVGFIAESFEHLESIEVNILDLEQNPDDRDIINNIFRTFHTIKGVSGFLNLKAINELAHTTENLLDDVRNDKRTMDSEVIDVVLSVGDFLREMVQNIKDVLEQGPDQYRDYDIRPYVERVRQVQAMEGGEVPPEPAEQPAAAAAAPEEAVSEAPAEPVAEEPVAAPAKPSPAPRPAPRKAPAEEAPAARGGAAAGPVRRIGDSIKVDVEKLDSLVNAVGELVIMQSLVRQNPLVANIADTKLNRDFAQLSRITTDLQRTAMSMRMVPIRQTFQKMIRLVRDLAKKTGKKVDLIMVGEETEIDRNMVDSIYDPLVHMIRNSVDHGVQTPAEREKNGKPPTGTVHLRAYQKGGNIVIEIEDDGEGLSSKKIRKKAFERGLIQEGDTLSDHEINNLIFLPGFSTADKITDVSGRGVGMDVVKKTVEKLRGTVEVTSTPAKGSLFTIRLPLTLAIIDGIIVRIGSERYVIPTIAIQESLRPEREKYSTVHGKGETLMIRDKLVPIIRLYEIFDIEPSCSDPCDAIVVVVENEGRQRALMVDELLGKQEVVIKSLGGYLKNTKGVAGATILGDGRVGLILDLGGIIVAKDAKSRGSSQEEEETF